jgi:dolichyl-phosphate-mannose--protein O-mannosyl transferase
VRTGAALHSHRHHDDVTTGGQQEVTGFGDRDDNDWWTVLEAR